MLRASASYASTLKNLSISSGTRIIYQGFTGAAATLNAQQSLTWGTNIVGGVTPGRSGEHLGLPLFPDVQEAARVLKPDATAVFAPARHAAAAITSAIVAEIPLVVAVAEHVPVHDMLRVHEMLRTQSRTRLVGANCSGIINPGARCRIGFPPHPSFLPGCVGIVAKSGTLSYEAVASTTRVGLGQSLVVGMGGDWLAGTSLADGVRLFLEDEETLGIVVIGEVGGGAEFEVAEMLRSWEGTRKPVMGLVAGFGAKEGCTMGHAGAVRGVGDRSSREKVQALEEAGVVMVSHPGQFGDGMCMLLGKRRPEVPVKGMGAGGPRQYHTRPRPLLLLRQVNIQRRYLHVSGEHAYELLKKLSPQISKFCTPASPLQGSDTPTLSISITIDRTTLAPCVTLSNPSSVTPVFRYPFSYAVGPSKILCYALQGIRPVHAAHLTTLLTHAWTLYTQTEAYTVNFPQTTLTAAGAISVSIPTLELTFDDAALFRHPELPTPTTVNKGGIVYIKLNETDNIRADVGVVVNGAGLAMNTCDVLERHGRWPANFLDTGGKATSETVAESFRLVLVDDRVNAVFVNIFAGLLDCGMIADGIILAFQSLEIGVPVVVRLRGTNEGEGQRKLKDSGLPLEVFDGLDEAAEKVVELAKRRSATRVVVL